MTEITNQRELYDGLLLSKELERCRSGFLGVVEELRSYFFGDRGGSEELALPLDLYSRFESHTREYFSLLEEILSKSASNPEANHPSYGDILRREIESFLKQIENTWTDPHERNQALCCMGVGLFGGQLVTGFFVGLSRNFLDACLGLLQKAHLESSSFERVWGFVVECSTKIWYAEFCNVKARFRDFSNFQSAFERWLCQFNEASRRWASFGGGDMLTKLRDDMVRIAKEIAQGFTEKRVQKAYLEFSDFVGRLIEDFQQRSAVSNQREC